MTSNKALLFGVMAAALGGMSAGSPGMYPSGRSQRSTPVEPTAPWITAHIQGEAEIKRARKRFWRNR